MSTLSIAMATYNGERFISEQLESILKQTVLPNELVVTDDGSTDKTIDIIKSFAVTAPFPVRVESNTERLGYRGNFMKAAGLCTSDYIAFSDQDDVWHNQKIEKCLAQLKDEDVLLVHHNAMVVSENLEPIVLVEQKTDLPTLYPAQTIEPWKFALGFTMVFSRQLLVFNNSWPQSSDFLHLDTREGHDQWFFYLASCLGKIAYINEPLALYRQHGSNTCGWTQMPENAVKSSLRNLAGTSTDGLKALELCACGRASALDKGIPLLSGKLKKRAITAAAGYHRLATSYQVRQQLYTSRNALRKSHQIGSLLINGGYKARHNWGVGAKAFVRDVVYGLILPTKNS